MLSSNNIVLIFNYIHFSLNSCFAYLSAPTSTNSVVTKGEKHVRLCVREGRRRYLNLCHPQKRHSDATMEQSDERMHSRNLLENPPYDLIRYDPHKLLDRLALALASTSTSTSHTHITAHP